ncbi:undecaprenyldiphospho-muramoylpentapeptide beta-N-acetylglucosaminyltransferase [Solimicrobium silvestre]|uniref:UDP-N-acetylglucosamine--N-acetylmuramyl-(pentapeptide) pyrophosphoryl-undecaprenol N-acetylglucosamine transferase n=1 Tax=Solimicrobium silvestre TaxID=2099400 RepID=A0A2S9H5E2_9BURK|nr:undecaprenyldiphospho-muramoylpentapeptide beta-N-acetylglucosaminyltransferase [Solimicrobium silvestre]PRC95204.1 murG: undecaprenyldiphospho-muramoylpentapeptide beta-N-acetylglucosaminyltransferase [Solimicrobium silvestre]
MNMATKAKRIMIMAAGTGGHIFPGLAIAKTLQERGWEVSWLGTAHGMEGEIVAKNNIAMDVLDFAGMRGKGWRHSLTGAVKLVASFLRCFQFLGQRKPDVVLGMGGYVTVPGGLMAKLRGIPLVLVNADAALLLSNKFLARFSQRVLFGFPADFGVAASIAQVTGNPVRSEICTLPIPTVRFFGRSGPLNILVVGGSLGAKILNETLPAALALLPTELRPNVTHQSGKANIAALQAAYEKAQVQAKVVAFIDDMTSEYASADLVICRAGAITVSELTAAGVASVLVPLMASSTTHQSNNASWMAEQQAALHLPQKEMTAEKLAQLLKTMTRADCQVLAEAAYKIGQRQANNKIADVLEELIGKRSGKQS